MHRTEMLIEPEELLRKLGQPNLRVFDAALGSNQYQEGHIPGAAYFDHERFSVPGSKYSCTLLPEAALAEAIGQAGIANDDEVVVYAFGMMPYAARAWWLLRYAGHRNVRVLMGGIAAWEEAGGALEREPRQYAPARFEPSFAPEMFADRAAVQAALTDSRVATVDVLPLLSYQGKHITGSICVPCLPLMTGMDSFQPTEVLADKLKDLAAYDRVITYCGGGIAAAMSAMAHWMVGQTNVAVYDGSLDEWIGEGLPTTGNGKWQIWQT
jgi:thiosulfate/3-mercaptopyruvate sulfurtransferase